MPSSATINSWWSALHFVCWVVFRGLFPRRIVGSTHANRFIVLLVNFRFDVLSFEFQVLHLPIVIPDDVKGVAPAVLRHRILPTYFATAEKVGTDSMIEEILATVKVP